MDIAIQKLKQYQNVILSAANISRRYNSMMFTKEIQMGEKAFSNEIHEMICTECGKDLVDYIKHNKLKNFIRELK